MINCSCLLVALAATTPEPVSIAPLDSISLRAGGFVTQFDLDIHRDEGDIVGGSSSIDLDRELDLAEHTLIESVGLHWLPWTQHEFGLAYFNQRLSGTRRLEQEIDLDDVTFPIATTVYSTFSLESFEFHYTWWLIVDDEWALGPRFGYVDYRMRNRIQMLLGERGEPPEVRIAATWEDHVPTPTFGLDFRYVPAPSWRVSANAGWFEASFDNVSPVVASARAGLEYFFGDNLGLWVDYGLTHLDVDVHSGRFDGDVEIYEGGLRLGLVWRL